MIGNRTSHIRGTIEALPRIWGFPVHSFGDLIRLVNGLPSRHRIERVFAAVTTIYIGAGKMVIDDPYGNDDIYDRSSMDKVIDLRRVFGPRRPGRQASNPPPIGVGEITSSARRDTGALEVIARLRQRSHRGQPGGLAWYTPTGLVRYSVVAPDQSRILWQGNLGRIPGLPAMSTAQREVAIRRLITQRTAQRFRNLPPGHRGPDLVPAFDALDEAIDDQYGTFIPASPRDRRTRTPDRYRFLDDEPDHDEFWPWAWQLAGGASRGG